MDLRDQLKPCLRGHVCFMGVGNVEYGDDAFGIRLAERLRVIGIPNVIIAGTTPDRWITRLADPGFDHVIFLDAVEFGGAPGSTVLLSSTEISAVFPQVSTHKISLGVMARWVEASGKTKAWLLGVQPESIKLREGLSPVVQTTLDALSNLLHGLMVGNASRSVAEITRHEASAHAGGGA